ncbi:ROK family transcriptional regulator [Meiothermus sp. QL-1]|uniref:ROK family transcriptional regulator n=1 Tax=Meiothermus sp. QL-1 TaxID=2058095 RepID=UPI000E0A31CB|nr:ROK family transcriptional regulator [Meiothermus sp. QL-1]RDI95358.1 ROK family transcriptional regulator [Meiothermus sp. QL-1]
MRRFTESTPTGGTRQLRRWHRARILQAIRAEAGISRLRLARKLGLSPSAVTEAVAELLAEGLVQERPLPPSGQGRPSVALELEGQRHLALAWEIDVDRMAVALLNLRGEVRAHVVLPPAPARLEEALAQLQAATAPYLQGVRVLAAGLSLPGLLEPEAGHLTLAPNLGWADLPLLERFRAALTALGLNKTLAVVENEANAAAYGLYALAGLALEHCVYLSLGVGVGGGVVVGRRVYHGARFHAGEVGHIPLDPAGPPCRCGKRGCAEAFLSYRRWQASPSRARLNEMAERLAQLLAVVLATLDPEQVFLGGPLVEAIGETLLKAAQKRLPRYALSVHTPEQVALSPLGREAALLGIGALAADSFVEQMAYEVE